MVTNSEKPLSEKLTQNSSEGLLHGIGKYHIVVFVCCWLGGIFDGMDSTLMSVVLPSAISELIGSTDKLQVSQIGSYVGAIFLLGWTAGGVVFGYIGDKFGRVKSMIFSILLYAMFTGLSGLAQNWPQLACCRFLTGLGIGGELVSIATFLAEVWPERSRAIAVGALITSYQA
ncbi:MAG: MFS transporter, partial [Candidatus Caenarcaniphilales bacterium]|nr:MFS transporter [Candidatus Caenarcaniphilales bacterium]